MGIFKNLFGKKKASLKELPITNNTEKSFKLAIINPESNNMYEVLGINEERLDNLMGKMHKHIKECETYTEAIEKIIVECKHINEVVFVIFALGREVSAANAVDSIIKKMKRGGEI